MITRTNNDAGPRFLSSSGCLFIRITLISVDQQKGGDCSDRRSRRRRSLEKGGVGWVGGVVEEERVSFDRGCSS